jgi:hypothetical protein
MKLSHAAALALVVWYPMRPPLPHLNPSGSGSTALSAGKSRP